jgi:hypothetical protein
MAQIPSAAPLCRFCGRTPAVAATVRGHRGMLVLMQWRTLRGPFCRDCGMRALKKLTVETLWQGWWGIFSAVAGAPFALISNLFTWLRIRSLPAPMPVAGMAAPATPPTAPAIAMVPGALPPGVVPPPPPPTMAPPPPPLPDAADA